MLLSLRLGKNASLPDELQPMQRLFAAGNWTMLIGLVMTLFSVAMGYLFAEHLSLLMQGVSHISTPVWATLIKFGFIMRIAAESRANTLQQRINREM